MEAMIIPTLSVFVCHWYLQNQGPDCNGSHRLRYHACFIPIDVQLRGAKALASRSPLTTGVTTGADRETANVVEKGDKNGDIVESEEGADVPNMQNQFIASETSKQFS